MPYEISGFIQLFVNNNFPMSIIDDTVKTFNEKMKPAIESNKDKMTTHDQINSELPAYHPNTSYFTYCSIAGNQLHNKRK